ncbi:unnamed protein product [Cunninghamella blakesleeana]
MFGKREYINPYVFQYENNHYHVSYDIMNKWRIFERPTMMYHPYGNPFFPPFSNAPFYLQQRPTYYMSKFKKAPYSYPQTSYGKSFSNIY